jgi:YD repeat-containing protein
MTKIEDLLALAVIALLAFLPASARAQQQQLYDAAGRNAGRAVTDSQGSTTVYDAAGNVTARTSTSGNSTTVYDAAGRRIGAVTTQPPAIPRAPGR